MNYKSKGLLAAVVLAGAVSAQAQLYSQTAPSDFGYFADGAPGQFYDQQIADSFTLGGNATINSIGWSGGSEFFVFPDLSNFSSFWLRIYSDVAGTVGAEVWSANFTTANTNPVANGLLSTGATRYDHTVATGGVGLVGGTYWLSVGSVNVAPFDDAYVWCTTTNVYDNNVAAGPVGGPFANFPGAGDMTMIIDGVPEPGTFVAIGAGLLGLLITRRRR